MQALQVPEADQQAWRVPRVRGLCPLAEGRSVTMAKYRLTITTTKAMPSTLGDPSGTVLYDNPNLTERNLGNQLVRLGWALGAEVGSLHTPELIKLMTERYPGEITITTV